jgi:Tfp pilus assembly protein PilO
MDKILKNIHWIIAAWASYNLFNIYTELSPKPEAIVMETQAIKAKITKNIKLKKDMDVFYKDIEEAKLKIQMVKESVIKTQQLLPSEISDEDNLALLRQAGDLVNIKSMEVAPGKEEVKGLFISKQYTFSAKATYLQFAVLFEKIANNKRMLNVKNVVLTKIDAPQRAKVQLLQGSFVLEAYRFNLNEKDIGKDGKAPGVAPKPRGVRR